MSGLQSERKTDDARLFDVKTHGWANVQACHVNLPLGRDEEAAALINASALLVPYLPALAAALTAAGVPNAKIDTLAFLAPAVRVDLFKSHLKPLVPAAVDKFALFTMDRPTELDDDVMKIYRKSLLYFVRNACEDPVHATPILGLEESVRTDAELAAWFGLTGGFMSTCRRWPGRPGPHPHTRCPWNASAPARTDCARQRSAVA